MITLNDFRAGLFSQSTEKTEAYGQALVELVPPNSVIALSGDLGSGKTAFTRGIARGCGIQKTVTSPTYNIYSIYQGTEIQLVHMDAYRLHDSSAIDALMLEEFLKPPFLIVVEWPERIPAFFEDYETVYLTFEIQPDHSRLIKEN